MRLRLFCLILLCSASAAFAQQKTAAISSPDNQIRVTTGVTDGHAWYHVQYKGKELIASSRLGVDRRDESFSSDLRFAGVDKVVLVKDSYTMVNAKKSRIAYTANKGAIHLQNASGNKMDLIFQVSNDGVAFRYYFPGASSDKKTITAEYTSWALGNEVQAWLQPKQDAQGGWEHTFPSYEEHYRQGISPATASPTKAGWIYPALFKKQDTWLLLTEAAVDGAYCATNLKGTSPNGEYAINFPDPREVFTGKGFLPESELPWYSPWRIITIGSLAAVTESTLGTDLAKPAVKIDAAFVKPGKASWSWALLKDNSVVYDVQKRFIDYAADMHWQYCLVDVDWDTRIGYDKMKELAQYANSKNVGLIVWYNSSGDWNTTKYHPKSELLTREAREAVFSRLQGMGIKGVKIDFFAGDGRSMMEYYTSILDDAARYKLLVNFHGATLPRGWQRTYPHLMSMEAVKGFEMITFGQQDANAAANHCTVLPFTRNAFDPMDFTPMCLYKIPNIERKTTSGFELALSVAFLSGIQHFAETPEGMGHVPGYVKSFLQVLPTHWDDVKFLDGFPGKLYVVARRAGNKWYVAGLNGEATAKKIDLNLGFLRGKKGTLITDGSEPLSFQQKDLVASVATTVEMLPQGGFVMVFE
ncbi:glycoside hydrolase family 97 protein [Paraflavitalea sp. CAU 1676]|uniref:glycoside hydrolase family 97 protein n=1 Tax=Paraflavitalea sp. CAU 1676 TaxID=3032598 RepID=UPI0023D99BEF|nr:glycoside hydrolase family 97 protein [Paraflavitalea sp. CAU 1676]MDF2192283.1 glycoside hydrolase family 97 catalytic domain-containing protein [Paraflavitalea sp. CAU 1676]